MSKIIIEIENGLAAPKWVPGVIQRYDRNRFRNEGLGAIQKVWVKI